MSDVLSIAGPDGESYRINDPGPGRVGSKLRNGEPYERKLLHDVRNLGPTGTAFDIGTRRPHTAANQSE